MDDATIVAWQLGRAPRGTWRVVARCSYGYPTCIATAPLIDGGEPFPTLFYLTCPHLTEAVSLLESGGFLETVRGMVASDESLASRLLDADECYRTARAHEAGGVDPTPKVGIAGQRDPLAVKCLHAHVAAHLAGIADPIGDVVMMDRAAECRNGRCEEGQ